MTPKEAKIAIDTLLTHLKKTKSNDRINSFRLSKYLDYVNSKIIIAERYVTSMDATEPSKEELKKLIKATKEALYELEKKLLTLKAKEEGRLSPIFEEEEYADPDDATKICTSGEIAHEASE